MHLDVLHSDGKLMTSKFTSKLSTQIRDKIISWAFDFIAQGVFFAKTFSRF